MIGIVLVAIYILLFVQAGLSAGLVVYHPHPVRLTSFLLSRSVLRQAKKKIPLLLPGFESLEIGEEYCGPFSDTVNTLLPAAGAPLCVTSWELFRR